MVDSLFQKSKNSSTSPPVWLMRQAGRYLPEYREVRRTVSSFLDLCYSPVKAAEVTLQPLRRFNLDAAIIFSDILVLPDALGVDVNFIEGIGPVLKPFQDYKDLLYLTKNINLSKLQAVYEAINIVKLGLGEKPLIGFVGGPWTVASYMLEGRGKQNSFETSKCFIYNNFALAKELIKFLTEYTIIHLQAQINAGATIIKIFDSWAGVLSEDEFDEFVIKPTIQIIKSLKTSHPDIPIIGFPKGSGFLYDKYINLTKVDIIAVDQFVPLDQMRKWQDKTVVQGNLDPLILLTNKDLIKNKLDKIFNKLKTENYVFNLGHGVLPNTPVENVEFLVDYINEKR